MAVLNRKPHRLQYLVSSSGYEDENGDYHLGSSEWKGSIPCDAVPSGKAEEREFEDSDVEGVRFVIAAAGDEELDEHITSLCNDKGIFINVVDVKDKCDFIFPGLVLWA